MEMRENTSCQKDGPNSVQENSSPDQTMNAKNLTSMYFIEKWFAHNFV